MKQLDHKPAKITRIMARVMSSYYYLLCCIAVARRFVIIVF